MPLIKSKSKAAVGKNISKEMQSGKSRAQSIAIALNTQRKAGGSPGGYRRKEPRSDG